MKEIFSSNANHFDDVKEETPANAENRPPCEEMAPEFQVKHSDVAYMTDKQLISVEIEKAKMDPTTKPSLSYIALISMAIQSSDDKKMLLSQIYQWISQNFPYYRNKDKSWRNSIRHNLSLNECFVKNGRSDNGKGNYWSIHLANVDDFEQGDYRRRHARRRVRKCDEEFRKLTSALCSDTEEEGTVARQCCEPMSQSKMYSSSRVSPCDGYVRMTNVVMSVSELIASFGADAVFSKEEQLAYFQKPRDQQLQTQPSTMSTTTPSTATSSQLPLVASVLTNIDDLKPCFMSNYSYPSLIYTSAQEQDAP